MKPHGLTGDYLDCGSVVARSPFASFIKFCKRVIVPFVVDAKCAEMVIKNINKPENDLLKSWNNAPIVRSIVKRVSKIARNGVK